MREQARGSFLVPTLSHLEDTTVPCGSKRAFVPVPSYRRLKLSFEGQYRITGNIGCHFILADWRFELLPPILYPQILTDGGLRHKDSDAILLLRVRVCLNMALHRYFPKERNSGSLPYAVSSMSRKQVLEVNKIVAGVCKKKEAASSGRGKYNEYTAEERARIGKYAAENGPARAVRHFSHLLGRTIPETTARRLKAEYLASVRSAKACPGPSLSISDATVTELPKMSAGRPLLLGKDLDSQVQAYIYSIKENWRSC